MRANKMRRWARIGLVLANVVAPDNKNVQKVNYAAMTYRELQQAAKDAGLKASGNRAQVQARLAGASV